MDLEEQQKKVIKEQRDQLMELRTQLKEQPFVEENKRLLTQIAELKKANKALMEQPKQASPDPDQYYGLIEQFKGKSVGKTLGLRIPDMMRERLLSQVKKWGAKSYTQIVLTCVELGLRSLEESAHARGSVEAVQGLLGSNDPRNGAHPPANQQAGVSRGTGLLADHQG